MTMFKNIVCIFGMPRSGTSWLSQIFDSSPSVRFRLSPLFSYEFKNQLNESSSRRDWEIVLQGAYRSSNAFMNQTYRRDAQEYPVFSEKDSAPENLVIKDTRFHNLIEPMLSLFNNLRIIAIVRHPCGAIHSWLKAPREFPSGADPLREWRSGACRKTAYGEFWGFDDWMTVTRLHLRLARAMPDRFRITRYEQLVREPIGETQRLFDFSGIAYSDQTASFLRDSHARHLDGEYAVFKDPSVADAWRTGLHPAIRDRILADLAGTDLEEFVT